jgi:hypothetical protein
MKDLLPFALFVLAVGACASAKPAVSASEQACLDTADILAKAAQRCGQDYKANYDAFIANAAGGSCANISKVRDESSLRATCIPSIANIECSALLAGNIDASCRGQLLRTASNVSAGSFGPASYAAIGAEEYRQPVPQGLTETWEHPGDERRVQSSLSQK